MDRPEPGTVRYMVRRDLPEVMQIEELCFDKPWGEDEYLKIMRDRHRDLEARILQVGGDIVGVIVTHCTPQQLFINRIAIRPLWQRKRHGSWMLEQAITACSTPSRNAFFVPVPNDDFQAMSFFAFNGFEVIRFERKKELTVLRRLEFVHYADELCE